MVRLVFSVELKYDVAPPGCDFIFNIHAAHTRQQRVVTEMMELGQFLLPQVHTDSSTGNRYMRLRAEPAQRRRVHDTGAVALEGSARFRLRRLARPALLVECGYHFEAASIDVALLAARRFLDVTGVCPGLCPQPPCAQPRAVRVVDTVTIGSDDFGFTADWQSMQTIARAGTVIAVDGGRPVVTPCDDCVLVMPSVRQARAGVTVVRFARRALVSPAEK